MERFGEESFAFQPAETIGAMFTSAAGLSHAEITEADRRIEAAIGDRLREDGLYFVGIDVIGDKLIEVNVTSPTLVREIHRLGGPDIADEVIRSLF